MSEEKENTPKHVTITPQQYRQLDFLRLFRLCRNLELFNRKRKMPVEYNTDDLDKNDKNSRSACRRLLRGLVVHIFPDNYTIKSNFNNYFVEFSPEMRSALSYINGQVYNLERSQDPEYREAARGYRLIAGHVAGFIYPRIPYSVKIHFSPDSRRRYRDVRRMAMGGGNPYGDYIWKPPESFYKCAKACLEYKEHWDKYSDLLMKVAERHKREEEEKKRNPVKAKVTARTRQAVGVATRDEGQSSESFQRLAEAVAQSAETGPRNTQESFNRALQGLLNRRNNG
jgi:hypothetical protein